MSLYEHVFLTRQDASAQQVEELTAQFKGIIEQMGGKVAKTEQWGVKSLSYRLRKNRKAHFTLFNVEAPAAALNEIERQERLSEDVLRYLTVRVDEHEEGPSAMMRKADRDRERDDRGFGFRDRDRGGFRDRDRGEQRRDRDRERIGDEPEMLGREYGAVIVEGEPRERGSAHGLVERQQRHPGQHRDRAELDRHAAELDHCPAAGAPARRNLG